MAGDTEVITQHLPHINDKAGLVRLLANAKAVEGGVKGAFSKIKYVTLEAQPWRVWEIRGFKIVRSFHI
jgi:hypothetical protein